MSAFTRVILGLVLGVFTGLFFGELAGNLEIFGEAYIRLLQMTVLPYVALSLICNIGRLSSGQGGALARITAAVLGLLWVIGLASLVLGLSFPHWDGGSFFTTHLVQESPSPNWIQMFIPANPFHSLAFGMVPAVVLFSLALGAALMGVANKQPILDGLGVVANTLSRVAQFVVRLAPIGVFAITARAAGTIDFNQFEALEVYLATYLVFWLAMVWFLPALTSALTPLTFRETMGPARDAFVTALCHRGIEELRRVEKMLAGEQHL